MTFRNARDTVQYVELPPFEPTDTGAGRRFSGTRAAKDSGAEDSQDTGIVTLAAENPFAHAGRESRLKGAPRRGQDASESEENEKTGRDGITVLSSVNPFGPAQNSFAKGASATRRRNGQEAEDEVKVTVLPALRALQVGDSKGKGTRTTTRRAQDTVYVELPPFSPSDTGPSRRPNMATKAEIESDGISGAEDAQDNGVVVLSKENPFVRRRRGEAPRSDSEPERDREDDADVVLSALNPFTKGQTGRLVVSADHARQVSGSKGQKGLTRGKTFVGLPSSPPSDMTASRRSSNTRGVEAENSGAEDPQDEGVVDLLPENPFIRRAAITVLSDVNPFGDRRL